MKLLLDRLMLDSNMTQGVEYMDTIHKIVNNDWFLLFAGLASIISLAMAFFAVNKVKNIDKSIHQKQKGIGNKQAGRDIN